MQESVSVDRWKWIGGSDIPVIMQISPFKKRWDLLQEKAKLKEDPFNGSVYTEYGNTMEPKIRDFINENYGHGFVEGRHYDEVNGYRCHTDGEDEVTETILEIKTTSNVHDSLDGYLLYLVQLLFYMGVTGYDNGILAVYERPEDMSEVFDPSRLQLFTVFYKEHLGLAKKIADEVIKFKRDLDRLKADPFLTEEDFIPKDMVSVSESILALEYALNGMKEIEARLKEQKDQLYDLMIENRVKTWATESVRLTRVDGTPEHEEQVEELDLEGLKRDLPELFKSEAYGGYIVTKTVKKAGRKGYVKITRKEGD